MIPTIEIDVRGYPEESDLEVLSDWSGPAYEVPLVLDLIANAFNATGYGSARSRTLPDGRRVWRFATGGWSGCEDLLEAMPRMVHAVCWYSSHRGGLHWYRWDVRPVYPTCPHCGLERSGHDAEGGLSQHAMRRECLEWEQSRQRGQA